MDLSWLKQILLGNLTDRFALADGVQNQIGFKRRAPILSRICHLESFHELALPNVSFCRYPCHWLFYSLVQFLGSTSYLSR